MRKLYITPGYEARACVMRTEDPGEYRIERVDTGLSFRGQGFARQVMKEVCEDADREGVVLLLVAGTGSERGLSHDALEEWYARMGFDAIAPGSYPGTTLMQRVPNPLTTERKLEDHGREP